MELTINLSQLPPATAHAVIKGLQHEDKAKHDLGVLEQLKLKRMMDQAMAPGMNTNLGRASMILSPAQRAMACRLYGDKCFADPDFSKFLLKHHPEFRIRDCGTRIQSGYTGRGHTKTQTHG